MTETKKLARAIAGYSYVTPSPSIDFGGDYRFAGRGGSPLTLPVLITPAPLNYAQELLQSRYFYRRDPFASTVINRMSEMAAGKLQNSKQYCTDEEYYFYLGLAPKLEQFIADTCLEYFVAGLVAPDYIGARIMGSRLHAKLGRKRYIIPDPIWIRNTDSIELKRQAVGSQRSVYIKISPEERDFITTGGKRPDGTSDVDLYNSIVKQFPDYVRAIKEGAMRIPMPQITPILRKPMPNCDYPQPFLVPALESLKYKLKVKEMDYSIASRAIEAIMLVQAGSDEFPVDEDDPTLDQIKSQMSAQSSIAGQQLIYKLFANHTIQISWVYPPLEALLSADKYIAVDSDIFMAMGFSRVLLIGETLRSNASTGDTVMLGPLATLQEARSSILRWIRKLYEDLADLNGFTNIPEPFFDPLTSSDAKTLIQYADKALHSGAISLNTYSRLFGTEFNIEQLQRDFEEQIARPISVATTSKGV